MSEGPCAIEMFAAGFASVIKRERLDIKKRFEQAEQQHPQLMAVALCSYNSRLQKRLEPAPLSDVQQCPGFEVVPDAVVEQTIDFRGDPNSFFRGAPGITITGGKRQEKCVPARVKRNSAAIGAASGSLERSRRGNGIVLTPSAKEQVPISRLAESVASKILADRSFAQGDRLFRCLQTPGAVEKGCDSCEMELRPQFGRPVGGLHGQLTHLLEFQL